MSLRAGGFCLRGRHLLAERDIAHTNRGTTYCRPCHRAGETRRRGGRSYACVICDAVMPWNAPRGPCHRCRPEIALLNRLYVSLTQERRDGWQPLQMTCPEGHALTSENTLVIIERGHRGQVRRRCRACNRERDRLARRAAKVRLIRGLVGDLGRAAA